MKNKRNILSIVAIMVLVVTFISTTYAFFQAQGGSSVTRNVTITTHTVDTLSFSVNQNISIEADQDNFDSTDSNLSSTAVATALLTPNDKTGSATKNYYMYLILNTNGIGYSIANTTQQPELLLQVFDESNQLVTLTGLGTQKTVGGLTGYDITGVTGELKLLDNHQISASSNTATTETWSVVITLINHNFNQNDNTGKQVSGSVIVSEDNPVEYAYWTDGFSGTTYSVSQVPTGSGIHGTYPTSQELLSVSDYDAYIKSTKISGTRVRHQLCYYVRGDNLEFCISPNYWIETGNGDSNHQSLENGLATKTKLKSELEQSLQKSFYDNSTIAEQELGYASTYCNYSDSAVSCNLGGSITEQLVVSADGSVNYYWPFETCTITSNGSARCY